jgi:hypothetical protein
VRGVGLDDDKRPCRGAADRAGRAVELDRRGVLGDVDGNGAAGVDATEGDVLAADADHAGGADPALMVTGSVRGRGGGPAGRRAVRLGGGASARG